MVLLVSTDRVFAGDPSCSADDTRNITGENINPRNDEHIIQAAMNLNPGVGSAAAAGFAVNGANVPGSETD